MELQGETPPKFVSMLVKPLLINRKLSADEVYLELIIQRTR